MRLHARSLAALFSGHVSPAMLAESGLLEAKDEALAPLSALFAGGTPWMPDFF